MSVLTAPHHSSSPASKNVASVFDIITAFSVLNHLFAASEGDWRSLRREDSLQIL